MYLVYHKVLNNLFFYAIGDKTNQVNILVQEKKCIIFCNSSRSVQKVVIGLMVRKDVKWLDKSCSQEKRIEILEWFKNCNGILVSTDLISFGIDFIGVELVVHFECPLKESVYVHRCGRTARNGNKGQCTTFNIESL